MPPFPPPDRPWQKALVHLALYPDEFRPGDFPTGGDFQSGRVRVVDILHEKRPGLIIRLATIYSFFLYSKTHLSDKCVE